MPARIENATIHRKGTRKGRAMKADGFWESRGSFIKAIITTLGAQQPWTSREAHNRFVEQAHVFYEHFKLLATHGTISQRDFCGALADFILKFVAPHLTPRIAGKVFDVADGIMLAAHMHLAASQSKPECDVRGDFLRLLQSKSPALWLQVLLLKQWRCADESAAPPPTILDDAA
jgi:hypothetical protein